MGVHTLTLNHLKANGEKHTSETRAFEGMSRGELVKLVTYGCPAGTQVWGNCWEGKNPDELLCDDFEYLVQAFDAAGAKQQLPGVPQPRQLLDLQVNPVHVALTHHLRLSAFCVPAGESPAGGGMRETESWNDPRSKTSPCLLSR
jgi:hypothetical protein